MKAIRYSKQREAIYANLLARYDHPKAQDIYEDLRHEIPSLSLGTVYRNLSQLLEMGKIAKVDTGEESLHYDGHTHPHSHFFCTKCKQVLDFDLDNELELKTEHEVHHYSLIVNGICKDCLIEENN